MEDIGTKLFGRVAILEYLEPGADEYLEITRVLYLPLFAIDINFKGRGLRFLLDAVFAASTKFFYEKY